MGGNGTRAAALRRGAVQDAAGLRTRPPGLQEDPSSIQSRRKTQSGPSPRAPRTALLVWFKLVPAEGQLLL